MEFKNKLLERIDIKDIGQCSKKSWYQFNHCLPVFAVGSYINIKDELLKQLETQCDRLVTVSPKTCGPLSVASADGYYGGVIDAVMIKGGYPCIVSIAVGTSLTKPMEISLHAQMALSYQLGNKIEKGVIFLITPDGVETHKFDEDWVSLEVANSKVDDRTPINNNDCDHCAYNKMCKNDNPPSPSCRNCGHCEKDVCSKGHMTSKPCVEHLFKPEFLECLSNPVNFHPESSTMEYDKFYNGTEQSKPFFKEKPVLTSLEIYKIYSTEDTEEAQKNISGLLDFVCKFGATVRNVGGK